MQIHNWINQLSNTSIWWLDICCLLHRYQLHVSAVMALFRLIDGNKLVSSYTLACVLCMVEGGWGWMGVRDLVCVE